MIDRTKKAAKETGSGRRTGRKKTRRTPSEAPAVAEPAAETSAEPAPEAATATAPGPRAPPLVPRPPTPGRTATVPILWTMVVLAVLGGGLYASRAFWSPYVTPHLPAAFKDAFQDPRLAHLADRVTALEGRDEAFQRSGSAIQDLEAERARFSARLQALIERVESLERDLNSVGEAVAATTRLAASGNAEETLRVHSERLHRLEEGGGALEEVSKRVALLERDTEPEGATARNLSALEARNRQLNAAVAGIDERIEVLEKSRTGLGRTEAAARAIALSIGQLREALRTSVSFANQLEALKALAGEHPDIARAIAALESRAASGIPTQATLRGRFNRTARDIVRAAVGLASAGWADRARTWVSSLVTIRRTAGDAPGDEAEAVVARAEAYLYAGDLIAAAEELARLSGPAADAAAPWLDDARARLAAEQVMATLHTYSISLLGPS